MQATPMFLGACALASFAGAVSGATINTDPIQRASIGSDLIQRPDIAFDASDTGRSEVSSPDQYAMTTPDGRVEVAELSSRGLYAQRRYGWREATFEYPAEKVFEEPAYEAPVEFAAEPAVRDAEPALALAEPAELPSQPVGSGPRVIDVAAALAAR